MPGLILLSILASPALAAPPPSPAVGLLADYDAELRGDDGRVDIPLLISQLKALGVNAYMFLIWHKPTDWDDLQAFLPAAKAAGIDVWAYLCPPSEPPPSQPFGYDYVRWGQELARLALKYPNLRAWVIDDFYANSTTLTPAYIAEIQQAARAINPDLKFLPLMYFPEIGSDFMDAYAPVIDGAVVAYPTSPDDIRRAARILRGEVVEPAACVMAYPWGTPSQPGDSVEISREVAVKPDAPRYEISLDDRDDFIGPTDGYHFKQLLIDGAVAWEEDVAGGGGPEGSPGDPDWHTVTVNVADHVRGKEKTALALRCIDKKGVSNFGVHVRFSNVRLEGFAQTTLDLTDDKAWQQKTQGAWQLSFHTHPSAAGKFRLPYVVMPAGTEHDLKLRLPGSQGAAAEVGAHVRMVLEEMKAGNCDGVVTYCLDKRPGSRVFDLARDLFAQYHPVREGEGPREP
jgi:hypothetical protein